MRKIFPLLICFGILISCQSNITDVEVVERATELHAKIAEAPLDTKGTLLKEAKELLKHYPSLHDSLYAEQNYLTGTYFTEKGNLDSASVYFQNATSYILKGPLTEQQLTYFYKAWDAYLDLGKYGECIAINQRFKELLAQNKNNRLTSIAHSLDKTIYLRQKQFEKALHSSNEQIKFLKKTGDTSDIVSALISRTKILDDVYENRTEVYKVLDSLSVYSNDYSNGINRLLYGQYGVHLFLDQRYVDAFTYFKKGLTYAKRIDNPITRKKRTSNIYNNLAEVCLELERYNLAKAYLDTVQSMDLSTLESRQQRAFLRHKFRFSAETNSDVGQVLLVLDSLNSYQNNSYKEKYTKDLTALKIANEKEKVLLAEKQDAEFNNFRLKTALMVGGIITVLAGLIGFLFYRQKKYGLERENLMTQQRLLRAQMNPHFTFNTLSVIREMIDRNPKDAQNYLVKFSRLLASIFENSTFNYVMLERELEALKEYMDLQRIRFPQGFTYTIELNNVEADLLFVPGMLLQPIIENSINHGFSGIDYSGKIHIDLKEESGMIKCKIEDNGKGIDTTQPVAQRKSSTKLIKNFLEKVTKTPFSVINKKDIFDNKSGVLVSFSIPFKETLDD